MSKSSCTDLLGDLPLSCSLGIFELERVVITTTVVEQNDEQKHIGRDSGDERVKSQIRRLPTKPALFQAIGSVKVNAPVTDTLSDYM